MKRLTAEAYTVAWLCALPRSELAVATVMLDEEHDPLSPPTHDDNSYTYGSINGHNVVIACMPPGQPGKVSASKLVQPLSQSFPSLKIHLFVGTGGGVPRTPPSDKPDDDIHLGDVVIGCAEQTGVPGVVQWDLVRYLQDGNTEPLSILDKPDRRLLNALSLVLRNRILGRTRFPEHLERLQKLPGFSHPGLEHDILFKSTYHHVGGPNCSSCDRAQIAERPGRVSQDLIFHQGTIVSGDTVLKDPQRRDEISKIFHDALCFEMEAAGVMDDKRCLIIRGIADYADSHKNSSWQNYAAGMAAAFAREFLFAIQPQAINEMNSAASLDSTPVELTKTEKDCLRSLCFPEIDSRKNDVMDPIGKTCAWLLKHSTYLRWLGENRGLLWLKGKPGAGKSTVLRYALKQAEEKPQDMLIVASFFFHGRGALIQKSLLGFFRSVLFQILQQIPGSLSSCSTLFKKKCDTKGELEEEKWEWQANELQDLFKRYIRDAIKNTYSVQVFVDALDECGEEIARDLVDFFQQLMDDLPRTKASLRIFFSCRHYPQVALENGLEICVEKENQEDIEVYVRQKLKSGFQDTDKSRLENLQSEILQRSLNVFQWVVLVVPKVILFHKKGKNFLSIHAELRKIPTKLNELYQELLQDIDDSEKSQSLQLMQWICFALRPLTLKELRFAIAVDTDTPYDSLSKCQATEEYADTDEEMKKKINDLSKGLVEVRGHGYYQVAQFVHQSVSDYLIQGGLNVLTDKPGPDDFIGLAHFRLSRSCIRYMSMKEVVRSSLIQQKAWSPLRHEFVFLEYAVTSWVTHAEEVEKRHISQRDLLDIFNQSSGDNFRAWIEIHNILERFSRAQGGTLLHKYSSRTCPAQGETLLHTASKHGFCDVVSAILDTDDSKLNSEDSCGRTPLFLAAENGNETVVKLLLARRNIAPDLSRNSGCTPLSVAAKRAPLEMFLARKDVNPNSSNFRGTPLYEAARNGHVEVVHLLLARKDVNPHWTNYLGDTPLHEAASYRHVEVVKVLLAREDFNPNSTDDFGDTLLHGAAKSGHVGVVEVLLALKDVNPNSKNSCSETPLHGAVRFGCIGVVKVLLAREDVNPHWRNGSLDTPLHDAARSGLVEVVKLLLARKDVDPNSADMTGETPLHRAARFRHVEVVQLLLAREDVNPNLTSVLCTTPLHVAASWGHVEVVQLLLAREDVNPNLTSMVCTTPLHVAASWGHVEVVQALLARKDVNPNLTDMDSKTPLLDAAKQGRVEIVKVLLARKDIELPPWNYIFFFPSKWQEEAAKLIELARFQQQAHEEGEKGKREERERGGEGGKEEETEGKGEREEEKAERKGKRRERGDWEEGETGRKRREGGRTAGGKGQT